MKELHRIAVVPLLLMSLLTLQNCKHDPPITKKSDPSDPDSLYVGTTYTYPDLRKIGLAQYRPLSSPSGYKMTLEGIQLGRMLFYDSSLSRQSASPRISCASCHKQQYAFGDNQVFSRNVNGPNTRNAQPLINLAMNSKFFWDTRKSSIEDAVRDALEGELHPDFGFSLAYLDSNPKYVALFKKAYGRPLTINEDNVVNSIGQFVRTLISVNSRFDQYEQGKPTLSDQEQHGYSLFSDPDSGDCFHCHKDNNLLTFTNEATIFANNGLDAVSSVSDFHDLGVGKINGNTNDNGKFKIPTLRNVEVSAPYMHDGRFATLDQVLGHYSDSLHRSPTVDPLMQHLAQGGLHISDQQKQDIIAFLRSLTDTSYLHNPAFSNPFH